MYDLSRPLSTGGWSSRPRAYKDIPALQNLAFFAEDIATVRMGTHKLEIMGGLRALSLIGLDKRYAEWQVLPRPASQCPMGLSCDPCGRS